MRLHHYDNLGTARFVTFSCYHRRPLLTDVNRCHIFLEEVEHSRRKYGFALLGYVVMPNHVHLVIRPEEETKVGQIVGEIKSNSARRIGVLLHRTGWHNHVLTPKMRDGENRFVFWQRRCYDHNCRTTETAKEKINYCHMNPVRAGLVDDPAKWEWSSYRWYAGCVDCVIKIDSVDL